MEELKARKKSQELLMMGILNSRMTLSDSDKQHYLNLKKGYEGEVIFDSMTENLEGEGFILKDLLLEVGSSIIQIDTTIVTDTVRFFEVKNYEGNFHFETDRIYTNNKSEILNPLNQLSRTEALLGQLLKTLGFNVSVEGKVVFINPEFWLYNSPAGKPIIYPNQLNRYLKHLNSIPTKFN